MNEITAIFIAVLSTICAALGQIGLKLGSVKLERSFEKLVKNHSLFVGFFFYALSSVLAIVALKGQELSVIYPIASLNYVWASLLSERILHEKMNPFKWTGIVLIIIGVIFVV